MSHYGVEAAAVAAAALLLVSGMAKVSDPGPISETLAALWGRVTHRPRAVASSLPGRALGVGEVGLAAFILLGRSPAAGAALALFGAGVAVAGLIGALGRGELPCACFGRHGRRLGYPHALQFPLWAGAAWCVARDPAIGGDDLGGRTAMLAAAAAVAATFLVIRMWTKLVPLARDRRRSAQGFRGHGGGLAW